MNESAAREAIEHRAPSPRPAAVLVVIALAAAVALCGFSALGYWQLERRIWKFDLIERVEARLKAQPGPAPGPELWPTISAAHDEYRRVRMEGVFVDAPETLVQAATAYGAGHWVLSPFRVREGFVVLVNRGFVPPDRRDPASRGGSPSGSATISGLLRMTEPHGAFLRDNDPGADIWRSRDVEAIARKRGLPQVAPYFVDADAAPNPGGWPVGGLTVVAFRNNHLVYALTWFALALMVAGGAAILFRRELRLRRGEGA